MCPLRLVNDLFVLFKQPPEQGSWMLQRTWQHPQMPQSATNPLINGKLYDTSFTVHFRKLQPAHRLLLTCPKTPMFVAGRWVQHGLQANQGEVQAQRQGCPGLRGEWSGSGPGCPQSHEGAGEAGWQQSSQDRHASPAMLLFPSPSCSLS